MLDELEELDLVLEHYAITWGVKIPGHDSLSPAKTKWKDWGLTPKARAEADEEDS
jgi:[phosphatase 2A protein]-leucine-carboxy methyltransferase